MCYLPIYPSIYQQVFKVLTVKTTEISVSTLNALNSTLSSIMFNLKSLRHRPNILVCAQVTVM